MGFPSSRCSLEDPRLWQACISQTIAVLPSRRDNVLTSALPGNPGSLMDTCMILHPLSCVLKRQKNAAFCEVTASLLHLLEPDAA